VIHRLAILREALAHLPPRTAAGTANVPGHTGGQPDGRCPPVAGAGRRARPPAARGPALTGHRRRAV